METPLTSVGTDVRWLAGLFLGAVCLVSGSLKLFSRVRFRDTLASMELLPRWMTGVVSWFLPPLEIVLGGLVAAGWWPAVSGPILWMLLLGFVVVLGLYRYRGGKELACGCFGDFEKKTLTSILILRNMLFLLIGIPLLNSGPQSTGTGGVGVELLGFTVVVGVWLVGSLLSRLVQIVAWLREETRAESA